MPPVRIEGRIKQKHDTTANWDAAVGFVPLEGEIIIYDDYEIRDGVPFPALKIGDGTTPVGDLPFTASGAGPGSTIVHTTAEWNAMVGYIPTKGTTIVYSDFAVVSGRHQPALKIGDGTTYVQDLPFASSGPSVDDFLEHVNDTVRHTTRLEKENWNSKVSAEVSGTTLLLR